VTGKKERRGTSNSSYDSISTDQSHPHKKVVKTKEKEERDDGSHFLPVQGAVFTDVKGNCKRDSSQLELTQGGENKRCHRVAPTARKDAGRPSRRLEKSRIVGKAFHQKPAPKGGGKASNRVVGSRNGGSKCTTRRMNTRRKGGFSKREETNSVQHATK